MSKKDCEIIIKIYAILAKGNDVEIRSNKDGSIKILEVKKNIVAM